MDEPMNIDTMDIIVVVLGVVFGMTVMYMTSDTIVGRMLEFDSELFDYALMFFAAIPLLIKRRLLPTPPRRTDVPTPIRMGYLLTAILGALTVGGALVATWAALRTQQPVDTMVQSLGGVGVVLLTCAAIIERVAIRA